MFLVAKTIIYYQIHFRNEKSEINMAVQMFKYNEFKLRRKEKKSIRNIPLAIVSLAKVSIVTVLLKRGLGSF